MASIPEEARRDNPAFIGAVKAGALAVVLEPERVKQIAAEATVAVPADIVASVA
jgi:hypothetical protein